MATRQEMNEGFANLERQRLIRQETNEGFAELRSAFDALNRTLLVGLIAIIAAFLGGAWLS